MRARTACGPDAPPRTRSVPRPSPSGPAGGRTSPGALVEGQQLGLVGRRRREGQLGAFGGFASAGSELLLLHAEVADPRGAGLARERVCELLQGPVGIDVTGAPP